MKKALVIHPFLFAAFPVLFLLAQNIRLFRVTVAIRPLIVTIFLALVSWYVLSLVLRDKTKAGLIVSLFFLLFFSYESAFGAIEELMVGVLGVYLFGTRAYVLFSFVILFALGTYSLIRTGRDLHGLTNIANVIAGCLVAISLIGIGPYQIKRGFAWRGNSDTQETGMNPGAQKDPGALPNIYYIIVDEYARADILDELYQFQNTEFLDYLTGKGFYVARSSTSNYAQTILSLASSLNLTYLDPLADQLGIESDDVVPAIHMMRNNTVFEFLEKRGYRIVASSSGYSPTEMKDVGIYMAPQWDLLDEFEWHLIGMTPPGYVLNHTLGFGTHMRRARVLHTFDGLVQLSEGEGPVFVLAHIMPPHPPFIFGQHGEGIGGGHESASEGDVDFFREQYLDHYVNQLIFINGRIEATVDGILSMSDDPTIIILQADTGPRSLLDWDDPDGTALRERFSILNAYYLPNNDDINLYDQITPVNTFRIIFNRYFGTDYELLEDESYFSILGRPYALINVTDEVNSETDTYDTE